MKILVVGGGGREHAIIQALRQSPEVDTIYALPGNGGIAQDAICVPIGAKDLDAIVAFAQREQIDFAVVAPDDPLVLGAVDRLAAVGIEAFGPTAVAAAIEGSKAFAKDLMRRHHIPTADYRIFDDPEAALAFLQERDTYPVVIKADGLALGKGVTIAQDAGEAEAAVRSIMTDRVFGDSGSKIVVEEFLTGPEVSVLAFTDGTTLVPMVSSMDHKRAHDGDEGPNTGGMGTIAPNPFYTPEVAARCMDEIFLPTIRAMAAEGRPFRGCRDFGLMLTAQGPKVIEYNCRFGDPETQVVLPLLQTDLLTVLRATARGELGQVDVRFRPGAACCVVVASGGYPGQYRTGLPIEGLDRAAAKGARIYHAGTRLQDGQLVTGGGRVLGVTATGDDLVQAVRAAYEAAEEIHFDDAYYRHDIGARALSADGKGPNSNEQE